MAVICAVYDEQGKQHYQGENGVTALEIAKSIHGTAHFKMYHKVSDQLLGINDHTFIDGQRTSKKQFYVPASEVDILTELLK